MALVVQRLFDRFDNPKLLQSELEAQGDVMFLIDEGRLAISRSFE